MIVVNLRNTMVFFLLLLCLGSVWGQEKDTVNKESGAAYRAGLEFYAKGQYFQAIRSFQEAYRLDERNVSALFTQGLALVKQKNYREAAVQFNRVLEKEPSHEKALRMLPVAYANAGDSDSALVAYDRGIEQLPDNYSFPLAKARLLIKLKRVKEAVPLVEKAHRIEPDMIEIDETLAQVYAENGRMNDAIVVASRILVRDPDNARAHIVAGDYNRLKGQFEEAIGHYRIAAKNIETKAYAEHFIEALEQKLEEKKIEDEYAQRLAEKSSADSTATASQPAAVEPAPSPPPSPARTTPPPRAVTPQKPLKRTVKPGMEKKEGVLLLVIMIAVVMTIVIAHAVSTYRKR